MGEPGDFKEKEAEDARTVSPAAFVLALRNASVACFAAWQTLVESPGRARPALATKRAPALLPRSALSNPTLRAVETECMVSEYVQATECATQEPAGGAGWVTASASKAALPTTSPALYNATCRPTTRSTVIECSKSSGDTESPALKGQSNARVNAADSLTARAALASCATSVCFARAIKRPLRTMKSSGDCCAP